MKTAALALIAAQALGAFSSSTLYGERDTYKYHKHRMHQTKSHETTAEARDRKKKERQRKKVARNKNKK